MQKSICNCCGKEVEKLDRFRGLEACEACCDIAVSQEKDFRGRIDDDSPIDWQREQSEGCLDDYNY